MEIVPYGQEDRKRTIGTMEIANITSGFSPWDDRGEYRATLVTDGIPQKDVKLFNWPRKRGCWALLHALLQVFHHRDEPIEVDQQKGRYVDCDDRTGSEP